MKLYPTNIQDFCLEQNLEIKQVLADGHCLIYATLEAIDKIEKYTDFLADIKNEYETNVDYWNLFFIQ